MRIDVPTVARWLVAAATSGVLAGVTFLIMAQGAYRHGYTRFDFAHNLGTAIDGTAVQQSYSGSALGVIGDTAGPTALYATLAGFAVIMLVYLLVVARFVRGPWWRRGLALGVLNAIVLGVVYVPYVSAHVNAAIGPWGASQGGMAPVVLILSGFGAAMVGARCCDLAASERWWEPRGVTIDETLEQLTGVDTASLELAEEGGEQGGVRP